MSSDELFLAGGECLADMMPAARAMQRTTAVLEREMQRQATTRTVRGTFVTGTVKGDIREIGKILVESATA